MSSGDNEDKAFDPEAFSRLYETNYRRILNYVLYSTGDVELASDLTSETFFKALRALRDDKYRGGSFTSWLYRIASREIAMHYRKAKMSKLVPLHSAAGREASGLRNDALDLEAREAQRAIERCEDFLVLSNALRRLPIKEREVLFLRFFEGRSVEQIAKFLDRPTGTVKSQIHHGLKKMRAEIQPSGAGAHLDKRGLETSERRLSLREEVE